MNFLRHIDNLPEKLVREILIYLPIRDAVRTSVLSKKWRDSWKEIPRIVFDDTFCEGPILKTKDETILAIYELLILRQGPLESFKLSLSNLDNCPEIDQFVLVVLKAGIRDLTLAMPVQDKPHVLHSSIITYGQQLEFLSLCSCVFKPPTGFTGFSKLVDLELQEVGISGNTLSSLISKCSLLEYLKFTSYTNCGRLDIVAPTLKTFSFVGLCDSVCFTNNPKLTTVLVVTCDEDYVEKYAPKEIEPPGQSMLSGSLPFIKNLTVDSSYSKYMTSNTGKISPLVKDLCRLETLSLWITCFGFNDEVSTALCLLKYSTNLKKLTIYECVGSSEPDSDLIEVEGFSEVSLEQLQELELSNLFGSQCELHFIKFILGKTPMMKKFSITPCAELFGVRRSMFYGIISLYARASPHVGIRYIDSAEDENSDEDEYSDEDES